MIEINKDEISTMVYDLSMNLERDEVSTIYFEDDESFEITKKMLFNAGFIMAPVMTADNAIRVRKELNADKSSTIQYKVLSTKGE